CGERGPAASSAMTNNHSVRVGNFFFDVELDRAATYVSRAGNVSFVPFVFIADIDDDRAAAVEFRSGILRRNLRYVLLRFSDESLETTVVSHKSFLTTNRHE